MNVCFFFLFTDVINSRWPTVSDESSGLLRCRHRKRYMHVYSVSSTKGGSRCGTYDMAKLHALVCRIIVKSWGGGELKLPPPPNWMKPGYNAFMSYIVMR